MKHRPPSGAHPHGRGPLDHGESTPPAPQDDLTQRLHVPVDGALRHGLEQPIPRVFQVRTGKPIERVRLHQRVQPLGASSVRQHGSPLELVVAPKVAIRSTRLHPGEPDPEEGAERADVDAVLPDGRRIDAPVRLDEGPLDLSLGQATKRRPHLPPGRAILVPHPPRPHVAPLAGREVGVGRGQLLLPRHQLDGLGSIRSSWGRWQGLPFLGTATS